jgi:hypothetical protein
MIADMKDTVRQILEPGQELAGQITEHAVGVLYTGISDPMKKQVRGPAIAEIFYRTCEGLAERNSGHREKVRCGALLSHAIVNIEQRLLHGDMIREDNFFSSDGYRSSGEEILDGLIIESRVEHQERKIQYYAHIFSSAVFDKEISKQTLNFILEKVLPLTFRQLCLLQLFTQPHPIPIRENKFSNIERDLLENEVVLAEVFDLYQNGFLHCLQPGADVFETLLGVEEIHPSWMVLSTTGDLIHYLMQLSTISFGELELAAEQLKA